MSVLCLPWTAVARRMVTTAALAAMFLAVPATASAGQPHPPYRRPNDARPEQPTDWVVLAPHPDDAVLLAAGVLLRARHAGERAAVIVMTNGDLGCRVDGLLRERESVASLKEVGVDESRIFFLGYPDGWLARLGSIPLPPLPRVVDGRCGTGDRTYGDRGRGQRDFHSSRHGRPAAYTAGNAVSDLAEVLDQLRPVNLIVTHPDDTHPDHAATYVLVRRAIDLLPAAPRVLRGIVHNGDCWPVDTSEREECPPARIVPDEPMPPLTGRLAGYVPDVRLPVPGSCQSRSFEQNPKLRAIAAHHSQTREDRGSYLFAFARREEIFFSERLTRDAGGGFRPIAAPAPAETTVPVGPQDLRPPPPVLLRTRVSRADVSVAGDDRGGAHEWSATSGGVTLTIDTASLEATLSTTDDSGRTSLRRWFLPFDSFSRDTETFEVRREDAAPDGGVAEFAVYQSGVLIGVETLPWTGRSQR